MFAVGKNMFQFKKGFLQIEENKLPNYMAKLSTNKSIRLLENYAFVNDRPDELSPNLIMPAEEYIENKNQYRCMPAHH